MEVSLLVALLSVELQLVAHERALVALSRRHAMAPVPLAQLLAHSAVSALCLSAAPTAMAGMYGKWNAGGAVGFRNWCPLAWWCD